MSGLDVKVEKLSEDNYATWRVQIKSSLIRQRLWSAIKPKPTEDVPKNWNDVDEHALAEIILSVNKDLLVLISRCETAYEAWLKLQEQFWKQSPSRKVTLYRELHRIKFSNYDSVNQYLMAFATIADQLKEFNLNFDEDMLCIILLDGLPESFAHFITSIETQNSLPTLKELQIKITEESKRHNRDDDTDKLALVAKGQEQRKCNICHKTGHLANKCNARKCYNCGRSGHYAKECRSSKSSNDDRDRNNTKSNRGKSSAFYCRDLAYSAVSNLTPRDFIWDSGATSHCVMDESVLINKKKYITSVEIANGLKLYSTHVGDIEVDGKYNRVTLKNVLCLPDLKINLLSINKALDSGLEVRFSNYGAVILENGKPLLTARRSNGVCVTNTRRNYAHVVKGDNRRESLIKWHRRYGHLNCQSLIKLSKNGTIPDELDNVNLDCNVCAKCKITEATYPRKSERVSAKLLELVHTDICGPFNPTSYGGCKYYCTFIDDKSRYTVVFPIKNRSDLPKVFAEYKSEMENLTGQKIKTVRSDNGAEYVGGEFAKILKASGIRHETTVPHCPQQNGIAERMNRTLNDMARCLINDANISDRRIWAEAVHTANYIRNRSPNSKLNGATPFEIFNGKQPDIRHLRIFGSRAIVLDKGTRRSKFMPRGVEYTLVGYSELQKGYRLVDLRTGQIKISRNVKVFEPATAAEEYTFRVPELKEDDAVPDAPARKSVAEEEGDQEGDQGEGDQQQRRIQPARKVKVNNNGNGSDDDIKSEPENYSDAINSVDAASW